MVSQNLLLERVETDTHTQHGLGALNKRYSDNLPFFILGTGRSGTSLIRRVLDSHPRLAVPDESHLYNLFFPLHRHYKDLSIEKNQERLIEDILSTLHIKNWLPRLNKNEILKRIKTPDFAGVVDAVIGSWAENQNKVRWGEKTPQHIFYWKEILNSFPNSKIIHIVRDGRDVSLSFINAKFGPKTVHAAAKRWRNELLQIQMLKNHIPSHQFMEIRYEDFLDKPEKVLKQICQFLGEEFLPEMLNFQSKKTTSYVEKVNKENLKKPLLKDNKIKWLNQMSKHDLRIFEAICYPQLIEYKYKPFFEERPKLDKKEDLYLTIFKDLPYKLIGMTKNIDGFRYEWPRLRILLRLLITDRL